jgi:adenosine deaminase
MVALHCVLPSRIRLLVLRALTGALLFAFAAAATPASADPASERAASTYLQEIRTSPLLLRRFMQSLPKGADLHDHASGAVYAERLIDWAVHDGLCVDQTFTLQTCDRGGQPLAGQIGGSGYRDKLIDALSMRAFVPGEESGHDHFFTSFDKFGAATYLHRTEVVAEAVRQAARDRVDYLELMVTFGSSRPGPSIGDATKGVAFDGDLDKLRAALLANGFENVVTAAQRDLASLETDRAGTMRCTAPPPVREPACAVKLRYIQQVIRALDPVTVFAQTMLGFELAKRDERLAGLNFVSPEDGPVAVRDYALHMRMIAYLRRVEGDVPVTLHAGELTLGLVPREVLDDHIDQAVNVAGARRIGHGVDVAYERNGPALLRTMAARHVLVEIALTSNDVILGVRGKEHPITLYLRSGVPIALVTDDEGVSRIDLTNEYVRAARDYGFSYATFKRFVRNGAEYAFLRGPSLWADELAGKPVAACARVPASAACSAFLAASPRASLQWQVERELDAFEARFVRAPLSGRGR